MINLGIKPAKLRTSDPKSQKYLEVQFVDHPSEIYLRYEDTDYNPPWNSTIWYSAAEGSWFRHTQDNCEILEKMYQECLKQS